MKIKESIFRPILITKGRITGKPHAVELRAVNYDVKIEYRGHIFSGTAIQITDEELSKKISELKYPGEERAKEKRVTIEITLEE